MDSTYKFPSSPGTPLLQVSPERVNQQWSQSQYNDMESPTASAHRESRMHSRDSSVHEKVAAFNTLAFQGKQLERKANDAALKRAMLGREEAESEMRRYREENRALRRQAEDGKAREHKVGERLETIMENYGRAKETYAHTQAVWEKEIRRARKEAFKSQSAMVKFQEELKATRNTLRIADADLEREKERGLQREQEAFAARYQLVGVLEEVALLQEQIKLVEQERDALRTIAKNEEVARIAAEGRMPLPKAPEDDEFASPKKARKSLEPITIISSAASEEELDEMRMRLAWEQRRADRALDRVEFLEVECRLKCCESRKARSNADSLADLQVSSKTLEQAGIERSTVFIPEEGVFRTILPPPEESPWISPAKQSAPLFDNPRFQESIPVLEPPTPEDSQSRQRSFARTPSCEPPAPAILSDSNASLLSLLDAPHSPPTNKSSFHVPTMPNIPNLANNPQAVEEVDQRELETATEEQEVDTNIIQTFKTISTTTKIPLADAPDLTPPTTLPADSSNPALSPTMSREKALAMIRERRGRARSFAQGTATPRKQMIEGLNRRDISAPAIRSGNVRGRSQART
ncbi:hypothetical protein BJ875DRAFT_494255 [Amylocarpus encephaloides]|uniref:Uncharacterized protein n=1 Tax=Amylocarpus encephaloides TaxID=45428 RepID=A0A9P8C7I2_9HELO|nr:hypothetical protein BJ875DRAFT_494255 [Amylocarpus encephaloides]